MSSFSDLANGRDWDADGPIIPPTDVVLHIWISVSASNTSFDVIWSERGRRGSRPNCGRACHCVSGHHSEIELEWRYLTTVRALEMRVRWAESWKPNGADTECDGRGNDAS